MRSVLAIAILAAGCIQADFTLQLPTPIASTDAQRDTEPCLSLGFKDGTENITEWPVAGHPIQILSTDPIVSWEMQASLLNETHTARTLVPLISQEGIGEFCIPRIHGLADWVGKEAVLQIIRHTSHDGSLYQVRFLLIPYNSDKDSSV